MSSYGCVRVCGAAPGSPHSRVCAHPPAQTGSRRGARRRAAGSGGARRCRAASAVRGSATARSMRSVGLAWSSAAHPRARLEP
eukprot:2092692-Prymnesium_polylepis.1